ncbi:unnamed protein product [Boreogadus saida]
MLLQPLLRTKQELSDLLKTKDREVIKYRYIGEEDAVTSGTPQGHLRDQRDTLASSRRLIMDGHTSRLYMWGSAMFSLPAIAQIL